MKKNKKIFLTAIIFLSGLSAFSQEEAYPGPIIENFSKSALINFHFAKEGKGSKSLCKSGVHSHTKGVKNVLALTIDPKGPAGAGRGPEIISNKFVHYGRFAASIKIPDVRKIQPDAGAVVGYFTYHSDSIPGLSEIDFEWLVADPEIIYVGTWTGPHGDLKRVGRTLNLAKGTIYNTIYKERKSGFVRPLEGIQNQPETIPAINGYNASSQFYTYGFDWYPDRIRWWMIHPATADTVVLWDYQGTLTGIPQNPSIYRMNFWHTDSWPVETNPNSVEKPLHRYKTMIDWMSYDPLFRP
jgi:beta-glucanase (GH16 family)